MSSGVLKAAKAWMSGDRRRWSVANPLRRPGRTAHSLLILISLHAANDTLGGHDAQCRADSVGESSVLSVLSPAPHQRFPSDTAVPLLWQVLSSEAACTERLLADDVQVSVTLDGVKLFSSPVQSLPGVTFSPFLCSGEHTVLLTLSRPHPVSKDDRDRKVVASRVVTWFLDRYPDVSADDGKEVCVEEGRDAVMLTQFPWKPMDGHFSEDWLFLLAAGAWVLRVDVPKAYAPFPVVASNVLIVIDSVWPQSVIFWDGVGSYLCRLRDAVNTSVAVVLLSDEYQQAPRFIYSETDHVFKPYVSSLQVSALLSLFLATFLLFSQFRPSFPPRTACRAFIAVKCHGVVR